MTSLYLNSKNTENSKRIYIRERKEKYEMINAIVYELNDLTYLMVQCEVNIFFLYQKIGGPKIGHPS